MESIDQYCDYFEILHYFVFVLYPATIKIIVVGNGGVGKTSMIRRFCTGAITDDKSAQNV